jgi:hypothetical protein
MTLADAQVLAARKLRTKAAVESAFRPGPPLPKSHPSPALIAKLHLEAASIYTSARALAKTPAAAASSSSPCAPGSKTRKLFSSKSPPLAEGSPMGVSGGGAEVSADLRRYLADHAALQLALGHMWLGIDAGEARSSSTSRAGDAVGLLAWAKSDLEALKDGGAKSAIALGDAGDREKEMRERRRETVRTEMAVADVFWKHYKKMNDTVFSSCFFLLRSAADRVLQLSFDPVPSQAELQAAIPAGRLAVTQKPFTPPTPAFGPGSVDYVRKQTESLEVADTTTTTPESVAASDASTKATYAGAGSYF